MSLEQCKQNFKRVGRRKKQLPRLHPSPPSTERSGKASWRRSRSNWAVTDGQSMSVPSLREAFWEEGENLSRSSLLPSGHPSHMGTEDFLLCHSPYIGKGLLLRCYLGCQHSLGCLNHPMDPFLLTSVTLSRSGWHFPLLVILGPLGSPEGRNQDWGPDREGKPAKEGLMET